MIRPSQCRAFHGLSRLSFPSHNLRFPPGFSLLRCSRALFCHSHPSLMKSVSRFSLLLAGMITVAQAAQKNVVLIAVDDLKPLIGAYGDPIAKTPNIDRLAARGLLFEHAYTNQALCAPSRNALLTGIRPDTLG